MHRWPFSCVSIGLTVGRQPVVGVVYNPILDEMYHAGEVLCGPVAGLLGCRNSALPPHELCGLLPT